MTKLQALRKEYIIAVNADAIATHHSEEAIKKAEILVEQALECREQKKDALKAMHDEEERIANIRYAFHHWKHKGRSYVSDIYEEGTRVLPTFSSRCGGFKEMEEAEMLRSAIVHNMESYVIVML